MYRDVLRLCHQAMRRPVSSHHVQLASHGGRRGPIPSGSRQALLQSRNYRFHDLLIRGREGGLGSMVRGPMSNRCMRRHISLPCAIISLLLRHVPPFAGSRWGATSEVSQIPQFMDTHDNAGCASQTKNFNFSQQHSSSLRYGSTSNTHVQDGIYTCCYCSQQ